MLTDSSKFPNSGVQRSNIIVGFFLSYVQVHRTVNAVCWKSVDESPGQQHHQKQQVLEQQQPQAYYLVVVVLTAVVFMFVSITGPDQKNHPVEPAVATRRVMTRSGWRSRHPQIHDRLPGAC